MCIGEHWYDKRYICATYVESPCGKRHSHDQCRTHSSLVPRPHPLLINNCRERVCMVTLTTKTVQTPHKIVQSQSNFNDRTTCMTYTQQLYRHDIDTTIFTGQFLSRVLPGNKNSVPLIERYGLGRRLGSLRLASLILIIERRKTTNNLFTQFTY